MPQLRDVAAAMRDGDGITLPSHPTKAGIVTAIVEYAVGRRADSAAIDRAVNPDRHPATPAGVG